MTFIWTEMLWLLLLVPALIALYVLAMRQRKSSLRFANMALVKQALGRSAGLKRHVPPALLLLALTVLIIAVARPTAVVELASSRATVILAMDVSGSMRAQDVQPSRLVASQDAAKTFIANQPADVQIGIVAFAGAAMLVQAPTLDRQALTTAIDSFTLRRGTAVGAGVLASLATIFPDDDFDVGSNDSFAQLGVPSRGGLESRPLGAPAPNAGVQRLPVEPGSYEHAVVILLTDGATTVGPDPIEAGRQAAQYGVRVYTVGFGSESGDVIEFGGRMMRAQLDAATLQTIADVTRAEYFQAQSSEDLSNVYSSLSSRLITEKKLTEIAFIFAGIGALLALAAAGLSLLWFGRIA